MFKRLFSIPLILLIILLVIFRTELKVLAVRIYTAVVPNAHSERYLGDYYRNAAEQNNELANQFYSQAIRSVTQKIKRARNNEEKSDYYIVMGRFYECGNSVPVNLQQAQYWYSEAIKAANENKDNKSNNTQNKIKEYQENLDRVSQKNNSGKIESNPCTFEDTWYYIPWSSN